MHTYVHVTYIHTYMYTYTYSACALSARCICGLRRRLSCVCVVQINQWKNSFETPSIEKKVKEKIISIASLEELVRPLAVLTASDTPNTYTHTGSPGQATPLEEFEVNLNSECFIIIHTRSLAIPTKSRLYIYIYIYIYITCNMVLGLYLQLLMHLHQYRVTYVYIHVALYHTSHFSWCFCMICDD